jgi:hypothetical protein
MTNIYDTITSGNSQDANPPDPFYVLRDIKPKRSRRTKEAVASVRNQIRAILEENHPQTVRQASTRLLFAARLPRRRSNTNEPWSAC